MPKFGVTDILIREKGNENNIESCGCDFDNVGFILIVDNFDGHYYYCSKWPKKEKFSVVSKLSIINKYFKKINSECLDILYG